MGQAAVTINGHSYQITCDDGQEAHLRELAQYIDKRVAELVAAMGQVGDMRLMVMTSLLIADELWDARAKLSDPRAGNGKDAKAAKALDADIESLAQRIEDIAARLERA
ncbi:MAG: cell division protein ZapA [Alphaproteobacteria bacterium]